MIRYCVWGLMLLFLAQCKPSQSQPEQTESVEERVFLEMRRTPCFGQCPAYTVTVYSTGRVQYSGEDFVPFKGDKVFNLTAEELALIQKEVERVNFFNLEDRYYKEVTDLPTTYLTVHKDGKQKEVMDYYGAPEKLKRLEDLIQETIFAHLQ